ncbi:TPA: hypothetical protein LA460_002393 [Clostridium botulinum]|nr:hypothetical protein [Clostridium botulinum]HBJ1654936.1 hypothetical protein [Clostridium botulinum]
MSIGNNKIVKNIIIILEKYTVAFITILIISALYYYKINIMKLNDISELFSNITSFVSIMLGILVTMATLFLGYANKQIVKTIRIKNAHKLIFRYFLLPISTGIILAVGTITLATMISQKIISQDQGILITSIYGGFATIFLISTIRIISLMLIILKEVFDEDVTYSKAKEDNKIKKTIEVHFDEDVF